MSELFIDQAITLQIDMHFSEENLDSAVELLMSTTGATEVSPECQECVIAQDVSERERVRFTTVWNTQTAFLKYAQSEECRRLLVAMDLCAEEPKVSVGGAVHPTGISYLGELRELIETE